MQSPANRRCQRVAHRGGAALAPENTLAAFGNVRQWPVDAIELDVQLSRDGQVVVFHDHSVQRLTEGQGNLLDLDLADLQALNAAAHFPGGWPEVQRIPLLRTVLEFVRPGNLDVHIEIKHGVRATVPIRYPGIAEAVLREIDAAGMLARVLLISFDWQLLSHVKVLAPTVPTGVLVAGSLWDPAGRDALSDLADEVCSLQCEWIGMQQSLFTPRMVDVFHARDLSLGIWTVNALADLHELAQAGVDALTSDRPDLFAALPAALFERR
ncbi:MAG TPA: glycerophosphodiester phosphodiesterase [Ktedonobacteraceae bacterium]|jgi:glycerophosphoryl diester phosphodiesterase